MWNMSLVWWEFVLRGIIIYVFLIVLLRLTGKRQVGQLSPFDLVLLLVLSNAVQNAMNGGDNSVIGGMISAVTLVGVNWIVGLLTYRSKKLEALVEGRPDVLIRDGKLFQKTLEHAKLTRHEVMSALREAGGASIEGKFMFALKKKYWVLGSILLLASIAFAAKAVRTDVSRDFPVYSNHGKPDLTVDPKRFVSQMEIVDRFFRT